MPERKVSSESFDHLRSKAEELLERCPDSSSVDLNDEVTDLIHELKVHQMELEIQNEELKESQQELASLHKEFERLYEFAPCGYLTMNPQGIVSRANLTAVSLLGAERKLLFRSRFGRFIAAEWQARYVSALKEAEKTGQQQSLELPLQRDDQKALWIKANILAERSEAGELIQWRLVLDDISQRKQAEADMAEATKEAEAAREAAEQASRHKSDFLAKMSHEIRTPMNSIIGMHRLVLASDLPAKQRERIQVAKDSAESLLWLLNDLLDLSKIEAGQFSLHKKEFRLRPMLSNVLKEMEHMSTEKDCQHFLEVDERLPASFIGDPYRLKRILVNLVSNAIKFTEQGWVSLEAELLDQASCLEDDNLLLTTILFKVKDTGQGIDSEKLPSIFNSYEQGDQSSYSADEGTGLGLAICKKLCQEMGGRIWADSQTEKGSIFYVRIPLKSDGEMTEHLEPCSGPESYGDLSPQRILLVEDQRMNQIFTVDLLTSHGHQVEVAQNGQQALDRLGKKSFDLVLMDIKMPVMDGIEATKRIRTSDPIYLNPEIPVVGLSAHVPGKGEQERFQSAGFDEYIVKPLSFESLFAVMKSLLDGQAGSSYPEH